MRLCEIEGCNRVHNARGYCITHYARWRKTGTTDAPTEVDAPIRFIEMVDKTSSCWNWQGGIGINGYGRFTTTSRVRVLAHRYAYELWVETIPENKQIDHKCHNRLCVNPAHLRIATPKQNNENRRGPQAVR